MPRFDPTRPDFSPYGFSCVRWTPTAMPRFDRHNEVEINLLESGSLLYLMGGRRLAVPAGRLIVFWAGVPHQILAFEDLAEYFVLTIPLAWFLQWRLPDHFTQPILHGATIIEPDEGRLALDRARFEQWSEDVPTGSEDRCHISLLEIEARLRRLATDLPQRTPRKSPPDLDARHLSRAEEMACFIARNCTQTVTVEMVARHVNLHPNYAMTLFQRTFGTTLIKYVTQHRLSNAQRLLVTTNDAILKIALSSGFGSLSRFNEAFRQSFGCTPRAYRRLHQLT
jgi:AraC family transcriptional regulator, melibiose operon regulatory protein